MTYTYDKDFIDYNYPTLISLLPKMTNKYSIKSGTTDTDLWVMGYNQEAVLGVWAGYDDNRSLGNSGFKFHKNIWIDTMEGYLKDKNVSWYDPPSNIVGVLVNPITGRLASEGDKVTKMFYFLKGTEPFIDDEYDLDAVFKEEEVMGDDIIEEELEGNINDNIINNNVDN